MGTKSVAQTVAVDRGEIMSRKTFLLRKHHRGRFCFFGGKHRAQTKAIKLFIFSCFAVETLRVSREEISFNIRFSHSPLFSAVRRSLLFPFFFGENLNRVGLWIIPHGQSCCCFFSYSPCAARLFSEQQSWMLCLCQFTNSNRISLSRFIVRLIFRFMAASRQSFRT